MGGGGQAVIGTWLLFFYTSYCNLSATQSALIMSAGQIVSGICGLIIGGISDNFTALDFEKSLVDDISSYMSVHL